MSPNVFGLIAAVLSAAIVVFATAIGISRIGSSTVESIARQPEAADQIRGALVVSAALIEGVALFALAICFIVQNKISL